MAEQVQSGPQQSRARRFLGAGKRTLDGEDRSERIKTGRKGTPFRAFSPTIKPEFPTKKHLAPSDALPRNRRLCYDGSCNHPGEVTEWFKVLASKASVRETVPWVRIPPSPPYL